MIGLENSRHPINQSDTKLIKTIGTWSFAFSRASSSLLVNLSFNWLMTFALFPLVAGITLLILSGFALILLHNGLIWQRKHFPFCKLMW